VKNEDRVSTPKHTCPWRVAKGDNSKRQDNSATTGILGHSPQMKKVFTLMSVLARTDASVMITGETGTGKDMIAEALHKSSQRARKPIIKVNVVHSPKPCLNLNSLAMQEELLPVLSIKPSVCFALPIKERFFSRR